MATNRDYVEDGQIYVDDVYDEDEDEDDAVCESCLKIAFSWNFGRKASGNPNLGWMSAYLGRQNYSRLTHPESVI